MSSEEVPDITDLSNGLILSNHYIPEEIVLNILIFVSWKDLLSCRLVCRSWKRIIDSDVGFEKLSNNGKSCLKLNFSCPSSITKIKPENLLFYLYFAIGQKAFGTNHLRNAFGSGENPHVCQPARGRRRRRSRTLRSSCSQADCPKFKHWNVTQDGGDGWAVEAVPAGSQPLPEHLEGRSCFVTSYDNCRKHQIITLAECGLNTKIMDDIRPHIEVSEWYARRFDCGIIYKLNVSLLDSNKKVVDSHTEEIEERLGDDDWHQVTHTFREYGPGVRYIMFEHEGIDTQFWAGHYGSKMAGGSVVARLPASLFE